MAGLRLALSIKQYKHSDILHITACGRESITTVKDTSHSKTHLPGASRRVKA